jgi:phosphatidate cytidylyltransferase
MIASVLAFTLPAFALGALLMLLGSRGQPAPVVRERWLKFAVFFVTVHGTLGAALAGAGWIALLTALVAGAGAIELARVLPAVAGLASMAIWPIYATIAALAIANAWSARPEVTAFVFITSASFDGFSQVVGQWLGRVALAPSISARKTVEGLVGGLLGATLCGAVVHTLIGAWLTAAGWGALVGVTALAGDLAKSWVKRRAGLKDFGRAIPGHGGFLDRFDSFLAANALAGSIFRIL